MIRCPHFTSFPTPENERGSEIGEREIEGKGK
jgi:hypothetical protein